MGVPYVNTFMGGDAAKSQDENWDEALKVWPPIVAFARDAGVMITMENCPMIFSRDEWPGGHNIAWSPMIWRRILEAWGDTVGLNYDPSHLVWLMIDQTRFIKEFGPHILHIQAKDLTIDRDGLYERGTLSSGIGWQIPRLPGLGDVDWARFHADLDDPDGAAIAPDRETYYADPNKGTIVFTGDLTLTLGDRTFRILHTPGHTPGQVAVHVPEERVVFTGDTIFSECQTWLMTSNVDQWIRALDRIQALDVDHVIPGHGPVTTLKYLDAQRTNLLDWKAAVAAAVAKGWTREETIQRVNFADRYPVDIGQGYMMNHIQTLNAASLWDKFTGVVPSERAIIDSTN